MELVPGLRIGWLNGWVLLALLYLMYGVLLLVFPKQVIARLYDYDRSRWSRRQRASYAVGRLLVLVYFALMVFTPLKTERAVFIPGIILFALGLAGFCIALVDFKNTPLDQPATSGLYRVSRHPQVFMGFILGCGICVATGSWLALCVLVLSSLFGRARTLAEEEACLARYGDSYRAYMERVPRYFRFV